MSAAETESPPRPRSSTALTHNEDAHTAADEIGLDRVGNLDIKLEGKQVETYQGEKGVTTYTIRVSGPAGSHVVHRRYKEFEELHHALFGTASGTSEEQAAAMPPRSFFRRTFSKKFRDERERKLADVASAALMEAADADADSCPPALLKFLGLNDDVSGNEEGSEIESIDVAAESAVSQGPAEEVKNSLKAAEGKIEDSAATSTTVASSASTTAASSSRTTPTTPEDRTNFKNMLQGLEKKVVNAVEEVEHKVANMICGGCSSRPKERVHVPGIYQVVSSAVSSNAPGLFYRKGKERTDSLAMKSGSLTKMYQPKGSSVVGIETGDGFLEVEFDTSNSTPSKTLYLPMFGALTKVQEPAYYRIINSNLEFVRADCHGVQYRKSKDINDRIPETEAGAAQSWNTLVLGTDEGDGWLKVESAPSECKYLPMNIDGKPVITLSSSKDPAVQPSRWLSCLCRPTLSEGHAPAAPTRADSAKEIRGLYMVKNDGTTNRGLYYRSAKIIDHDVAKQMGVLTEMYQPWDTAVVGADTLDGFLKVEVTKTGSKPPKFLYLPFRHQGDLRVEPVKEPTPAYYLLHCTHMSCDNPSECAGMRYRKSKDMKNVVGEDDHAPTVDWNNEVLGVDQGDGWLKLDDSLGGQRYLPMKLDGEVVASLSSSKDKPTVDKSGGLKRLAICCR